MNELASGQVDELASGRAGKWTSWEAGGHGNFSTRMVARFNRLCCGGRILSAANRIEAAIDGR
jgi:hypothetical protein